MSAFKIDDLEYEIETDRGRRDLDGSETYPARVVSNDKEWRFQVIVMGNNPCVGHFAPCVMTGKPFPRALQHKVYDHLDSETLQQLLYG